MKALKSRLAETVLADSDGGKQLRQFLTGCAPRLSEPSVPDRTAIDIRLSNGHIVHAAIVPKPTNR
jgi:hypothetical protein